MRHRLHHSEISRNKEGVGSIAQAQVKLLKQRLPSDPRRRTYAHLIAKSFVLETMKRNVAAIKAVKEGNTGNPTSKPRSWFSGRT